MICKWKPDEDGVYETGCGNRFEFTEAGPKENKFDYCPYCGNVLKIVILRARHERRREAV